MKTSEIYLFSEHFGQKGQHFFLCGCVDLPKPLDKSRFINGSNLVKHDLAVFSLKTAWDAGRICLSLSGHWRDDDCRNMLIHFVGGNDKAGPRLLDFSADGRIKIDQIDIKAFDYHTQ